MMRTWLKFILVVLLGSGLTGAALGQSTNAGDVNGLVTDATGAALPGVTVTVENIDTGVVKTYTTNNDGLYDTSSIVAGNYKISFEKVGFSTLVRPSITVTVGTTPVPAQLAVGAVTERIVVDTDVPLLRTESGEQSTTLDARTLHQLPQVGQDWSSFDILLPGAAGTPMGAQGSTGTGTSNGTSLSVNGNLPFSTVLADGATTTLPASANSDIDIQETIQEVQILTSAFSAQYGIGGVLYNQISKGGTDSFHGAAYEYFQNDAMNADNYFGGKSVLRYHNFGGAIGGPIIKRKLFFFFDYDQIVQHGGNQPDQYTIPTPAVMSGDFTGAGFPTIYDPATTTIIQQSGSYLYPGTSTPVTCPCFTRTSFAAEYGNGNRIPSSRIDPVAAAIQAYFPKANYTPSGTSAGVVQNNYSYTSPASNPFKKYFGRLDYDIRGNNRLTMSNTEGDNPGESFGGGICPIDCQGNDVSRENAQVTDVWTISPHLINEARFGYTNQLNFFSPLTLNQGWPAKLGWKFAKADNFPSINITNYNNGSSNNNTILSSQTNAVYKEHAYDPSDVMTLIVGKHSLHFGGEVLIYQNNSTAWGNLNAGTMTYTGDYTRQFNGDNSSGTAYADFLLGQTQSWNANVLDEFGGRLKVPQIFIQDDYKVTTNLTLNLGLRYQIQTGWSEVNGNEASFDPTINNPATNTLGAMWYGSTHANGRNSIQQPVYTTVLPRLGFAYQMNPNTVIRGGFGMYAYNWSNDTYNQGPVNGGIMGSAFGGKGNVSDQTNGITPVVVLSGSGSNLPYVLASTDPAAYNGQNQGYAAYHQPVGGSYQWNIQGQRQLSSNMVATLAYVATHGHDLPFPVDFNQVPVNKLAANDQGSRPFPQFGELDTAGTPPHENAISNYNSLQATFQRRFSHGLEADCSYVWSHFLDDMDSSGWGSHTGDQWYQNAYVPSANYGNANFDVRNAFKADALYQLPFGSGRQFLNNNKMFDTVIGGWQLATTVVIMSGQPFTAVMADPTNSYAQSSQHFGWFPNVVGNPQLKHPTVNQWFNEAAFAVPTPGTFGNEGRNSLTMPPFSRVNFSLGKTFAFTERLHFELRADANNAFNHPAFGEPNNKLNVNSDGTTATDTSAITSVTSPARTMQLSGRFSF